MSNWLINISERLVYCRFSKLDEICSKYRHYFIYAIKYSMPFQANEVCGT